ncbi:MAG: glycosyltransferase family 2 protein [Planctomycetaceae bacterium]|nr:glycosyltransferase family 2 protein [Planctomycetaceae bacterium]
MERSLTVLLPVENSQATLAKNVRRLLEVLPDLTDSFEVVVIDDGSTDATLEVADELSTQYPQIRVVRSATPRGRTRAIQLGVRESRGEFLLLIDEDANLPIDEIGRLWAAAEQHDVVLGRLPSAAAYDPNRFRRLDGPSHGGYQILRRRAVGAIWDSLGHQLTLRAELARTGGKWFEIEIGSHRAGSCNRGPSPASRPQRPNYLQAIRDFTFGE